MYKCIECSRECAYDDRALSDPVNCGDCGAKPGKCHKANCDVERCSVCLGQRLMCGCKGHKRKLTAWSGYWPGIREGAKFKLCLNCVFSKDLKILR